MNFFSLFSVFQPDRLARDEEPSVEKIVPDVKRYCSMIDEAEGFSAVWEIVKDTVRVCLGKHRQGMLLFLDDLPLHLGAYHQLGTNNIVLNRSLLNIVEAATKSRKLVNAFVYTILTHEYLHALGHVSETKVRSLVYEISKQCFGEKHIVTSLAENTPWSLLKGVPLYGLQVTKKPMELIKDLEKQKHSYIV
jgi:hypothetical protein